MKLEMQIESPVKHPFWATFIPVFCAVFGALFWVIAIGSCGSDAPPDPLTNGESCMMDDECESVLCVTEFKNKVEIAGGMCTVECSFENDGADCTEDEVCLRYNATGELYCFQQCVTNEDCREGWTCFNLVTDRACTPPL